MFNLNVEGIRNIEDVFNLVGKENNISELLATLGIYNKNALGPAGRRRSYPLEFAKMTDDALSNENSYWNHQLSAITELLGAVEAQKLVANLKLKSTKYAAKPEVRKTLKKELGKEPANTMVNDEVENNEAVKEATERYTMLEVIAASAKAYKEACASTVAGISREISFRQDQYRSNLR